MHKIPKIIHIIWIGDQSKKPHACIKSWVDNHPGWDVRVHGNELYETYKDFDKDIKRIREINGHADVFRWLLLYDHGGVAVDADSFSVRPLPEWMLDTPFSCYESETLRPGLLACGAMGFTPGHPMVSCAIADIVVSKDLETKMAWETVGTQCLTRAHRSFTTAQPDSPFKIYPSHYFIPQHFASETEYQGEDVYAKQLWGSTFKDYGSTRFTALPENELKALREKAKLMVAFPNTGTIRTELLSWLMQVQHDFKDNVRFDLRDIRGMPVDVCRNKIVKRFLESDNEWLMMVDSDVVPPVNIICALAIGIKHDLGFIGFPTPIFRTRQQVEWNFGWVMPQEGRDPRYPLTRIADRRDFTGANNTRILAENRKPMILIDRIGTGCVLIHREVLEAVPPPAFNFAYDVSGDMLLGEDYLFCDKVRAAGYDIWCDLENPCEHYKDGIPLSKFMQY